jgi:CheY-like chemotaxis protein
MPRILVVDDEAGVCSVIQLLLARQGYAVTTMTNGRAALEAVRRDEYAAALIDLNLAEIDGIEIIRAALSARPDMPIVMMSGMVVECGHVTPDSLGISAEAHGVRRLAKPFKPKDLLQLMAELLPPETVPAQRTAADIDCR